MVTFCKWSREHTPCAPAVSTELYGFTEFLEKTKGSWYSDIEDILKTLIM